MNIFQQGRIAACGDIFLIRPLCGLLTPSGRAGARRATERVATFENLDTSLPSPPLWGTSPVRGGMGKPRPYGLASDCR